MAIVKKDFYFVVVLILCLSRFSNSSALPRTLLISIPKCGTHLLIKCIKLLSGAQLKFTGDVTIPHYIDVSLSGLQSDTFLVSHIPSTQDFVNAIGKHNVRVLFIYRDPRDQLVSYAHYIRNNNCSKHPHPAWPMARDMSLDEIIDSLMTEKKLYHFFHGISDVNEFYRAFMPWMNFKDFLVIRFEDLIGTKGGGSLDAQRATVKAVANYLDISLTEQKLQYVIDTLFGGGSAFRIGQIGSWKTTFNQRQKEVFKKVAGQLLIDLGYEKDFDW